MIIEKSEGVSTVRISWVDKLVRWVYFLSVSIGLIMCFVDGGNAKALAWVSTMVALFCGGWCTGQNHRQEQALRELDEVVRSPPD